jgi:hypothetical protein
VRSRGSRGKGREKRRGEGEDKRRGSKILDPPPVLSLPKQKVLATSLAISRCAACSERRLLEQLSDTEAISQVQSVNPRCTAWLVELTLVRRGSPLC